MGVGKYREQSLTPTWRKRPLVPFRLRVRVQNVEILHPDCFASGLRMTMALVSNGSRRMTKPGYAKCSDTPVHDPSRACHPERNEEPRRSSIGVTNEAEGSPRAGDLR
jgi:hypothetical protein